MYFVFLDGDPVEYIFVYIYTIGTLGVGAGVFETIILKLNSGEVNLYGGFQPLMYLTGGNFVEDHFEIFHRILLNRSEASIRCHCLQIKEVLSEVIFCMCCRIG